MLGGALLVGCLLAVLAVVAPAMTAPFQWPLAFVLLGVLQGRWLRPAAALAVRYVALIPACVAMLRTPVTATLVATGASMPFVPAIFGRSSALGFCRLPCRTLIVTRG